MLERAFDPQKRPELSRLAHERAIHVGRRGVPDNPLAKINLSVVETRTRPSDGRVFVTHHNPDWTPAATNFGGVLEVVKRYVHHGVLLREVPFPVESLQPAPEQLPTPELMKKINSPKEIRDPQTRQKHNVIRANWRELTSETTVNVYPPLYLNTINDGRESEARIIEIARQMPNLPLLAFNHLKNGGSTKKEDSYFANADALLGLMQQLGIKEINPMGLSMGAYASLAIAARARKFDINVKNLILGEIPGVKHMFGPQMAYSEWREGAGLELNHSSPADPVMWEASGLTSPDQQEVIPPMQLLKDVREKDPWLRYGRAMTKDTVRARLAQVLATQSDAQIVFVNGSLSTISPVEEVSKIVTSVPTRYKARVNQVIFSGEGHLAIVHPKRFAGFVRLHVESKVKNQ